MYVCNIVLVYLNVVSSHKENITRMAFGRGSRKYTLIAWKVTSNNAKGMRSKAKISKGNYKYTVNWNF